MMSDGISNEEVARIGLLADAVVEALAKRYGVTPNDVVSAVRWVHEHREFVSKMKHSGFLALIGIMISASLLSLWEGIKAYLRGER